MGPTSPLTLAADLDRIADASWPAETQVRLGPWKLRATHGVTNRANSVLTTPPPGWTGPADVDRLIEAAEAFYTAHGLRPIFQISPGAWPADLDAVLAAQGYVLEKPSEVWTADAAGVRDGTAADGVPGELVLRGEPDVTWFDRAYDEPLQRRRVHEAIVRRIPHARLFVSVRHDAVAAACGFGVSVDGWTGVYSMQTHPEHRGRGLGRTVLHQLARWATGRGDRRLYLLVTGSNVVARRLYARCGFTLAYAYHYRARR